ncbi:MAG: NosD domain-containing protein [Promethearchaeota archaeon]
MLFGLTHLIDLESFGNFNVERIKYKDLKINKSSPKIHIIGNAGWVSFKDQGNCTGQGTITDPYILDNREINAENFGCCIQIENSDVYFKILNCTLWNPGNDISIPFQTACIRLDNVFNGIIENNTLFAGDYLIILDESENNKIQNNTLTDFGKGIYFETNCQNISISLNYFDDGTDCVSAGFTYPSTNINIHNNTMINTFYGTYLRGGNHRFTNNIFKFGGCGIRLEWSNNSKVFKNRIVQCSQSGMYIVYSNNTQVINNTINQCNLEGGRFGSNENFQFINNTVSYNGYDIWASSGVKIESSSNIRFLNNTLSFNAYDGLYISGELGTSNYNRIINNRIYSNENDGISLYLSPYSTIKQNNIYHNGRYGLYIESSSYNNITKNILKDDSGGPYAAEIYLDGNNNSIFANYFIHSAIWLARQYGSGNQWNSSQIGNYWSSYTGFDENDDGIGDTPYTYLTIIDYLPIWYDGPTINIKSPQINEIYKDPPNFIIESIDPELDTLWYIVNQSNNKFFIDDNGSIDLYIWKNLADGNVSIKFFGNDTYGNVNFKEIMVTKDNCSPKIEIIYPNQGLEVNRTAPDYIVEISDLHPVMEMWYCIGDLEDKIFFIGNGTINQSLWELVWDSLADNDEIILNYYAIDIVGNLGYAEVILIKFTDENDRQPAIPGYNLLILINIIAFISLIIKKKISK